MDSSVHFNASICLCRLHCSLSAGGRSPASPCKGNGRKGGPDQVIFFFERSSCESGWRHGGKREKAQPTSFLHIRHFFPWPWAHLAEDFRRKILSQPPTASNKRAIGDVSRKFHSSEKDDTRVRTPLLTITPRQWLHLVNFPMPFHTNSTSPNCTASLKASNDHVGNLCIYYDDKQRRRHFHTDENLLGYWSSDREPVRVVIEIGKSAKFRLLVQVEADKQLSYRLLNDENNGFPEALFLTTLETFLNGLSFAGSRNSVRPEVFFRFIFSLWNHFHRSNSKAHTSNIHGQLTHFINVTWKRSFLVNNT
ncbi:hypothetical protein TNCV_4621771 [Trichonephila clavipes]|nr:hypothetical protein TNCV_4621771 [Trichonephila clavipes]